MGQKIPQKKIDVWVSHMQAASMTTKKMITPLKEIENAIIRAYNYHELKW